MYLSYNALTDWASADANAEAINVRAPQNLQNFYTVEDCKSNAFAFRCMPGLYVKQLDLGTTSTDHEIQSNFYFQQF